MDDEVKDVKNNVLVVSSKFREHVILKNTIVKLELVASIYENMGEGAKSIYLSIERGQYLCFSAKIPNKRSFSMKIPNKKSFKI